MAEFKGITLPDDLYYDAKEHIWAKVEGDKVRVGLDAFGLKASGGNTQYIKLKPAGAKAIKSRPFGSIEAGKYIGPLKAPVNGSIAEVNQKAVGDPSLVNTDNYGEGHFLVIEPSSLEEDLKDLVSGAENIQKWLEEQYAEYEAKGLFKEEE
jgi:glycine cleavage system H protein